MQFKIKTSEANRARITDLTNKWQLGAENVIARLAFAHSLKSGEKLELGSLEDSKGKEYSSRVLFGELEPLYIAMICQHYSIYKSNTDIPKLVKAHVDAGLSVIREQADKSGFEFLTQTLI